MSRQAEPERNTVVLDAKATIDLVTARVKQTVARTNVSETLFGPSRGGSLGLRVEGPAHVQRVPDPIKDKEQHMTSPLLLEDAGHLMMDKPEPIDPTISNLQNQLTDTTHKDAENSEEAVNDYFHKIYRVMHEDQENERDLAV